MTDGYYQTENDVLLYSYNKHYLKDYNIEKLFLHFIYLKTDSNPLTIINFVISIIYHP